MANPKTGESMFLRRLLSVIVSVFLVLATPGFGFASSGDVNTLPPALSEVGVTEHIGDHLPFDAVVTDSAGNRSFLGDYFKNGRPKILVFAYYTCPMLCGLVLDGTAKVVSEVPGLGEDYDVLTISINPSETVESAAAFESKYNAQVRGGSVNEVATANKDAGWHFLVGHQGSEKKIADAAGFGYQREENGEYAHASLIMLVSADGKMTRYLYGIEHRPFDLKLALAEAKVGKGVSSVERVLLFCYNYDPDARGYVLFAVNMMRIGGLVTVFLLAGLLVWLARTSKGRKA